MLDWLLLTLSGSAHHALDPQVYWHARSMVLAWAVLLPLGALAARYGKVTPSQQWPRALDNKAWWHGHRVLQWAGIVAMSFGVWLVWRKAGGASTVAAVHGWAGWVLVAAGWLQIVSGLLRGSKGGPTSSQARGDHYDMTPRRVRFERMHKGLGWLCVVASIGVTALGLIAADAPRWMALMLCAWWLVLGAVAVRLQRQGRCIDTYQAIWGPDLTHPGNRVEPVGWGIRRFPTQDSKTHG